MPDADNPEDDPATTPTVEAGAVGVAALLEPQPVPSRSDGSNETGGELSPPKRAMVQSVFDRYLPGVSSTIQLVDDIPLTAGGKRRLVMSEMQ